MEVQTNHHKVAVATAAAAAATVATASTSTTTAAAVPLYCVHSYHPSSEATSLVSSCTSSCKKPSSASVVVSHYRNNNDNNNNGYDKEVNNNMIVVDGHYSFNAASTSSSSSKSATAATATTTATTTAGAAAAAAVSSSTKRNQLIVVQESDDDDDDEFPDDGIARISWEIFMGFSVSNTVQKQLFGQRKEEEEEEERAPTKDLKRKHDQISLNATTKTEEDDSITFNDNNNNNNKRPKVTWKDRYLQLKAYKKTYGHTGLSQKNYNSNMNDETLVRWTSNQRCQFTRRVRGDITAMSDTRFVLLQDLGLEPIEECNTNHHHQKKKKTPPPPSPPPSPPPPPPVKKARTVSPEFQTRLDQLHAFQQCFGHWGVPKDYVIVPGLYKWLQHVSNHPELLTDDERGALDDVQFKWPNGGTLAKTSSSTTATKTTTTLSAATKRKTVLCAKTTTSAAAATKKKKVQCAKTTTSAAATTKKKKVLCAKTTTSSSATKKKKVLCAAWEKRIQQLKEYFKENGDYNVPLHYSKDPSLGSWVKQQRNKFTERKRGNRMRLADHKYEALEKMGFNAWAIKEAERTYQRNGHWFQRLEQLKAYKEEHGNCRVPVDYKKDPALGDWVREQRAHFTRRKRGNAGIMTDFKFEALQAVGLEPWAKTKATFQKEFEAGMVQLQAFRKEHGHARVPKDCSIHGLRKWVVHIRRLYKKKSEGNPSNLSDENIAALNDIGFVWFKKKKQLKAVEPSTRQVEFTGGAERKSTGNATRHHAKPDENPNTKHHTSNGDNGTEKTVASWQTNFEKLKSFKMKHGHCKLNVSVQNQDPKFAAWVTQVRRKYSEKRKGATKLAEEKYAALRGLGFEHQSQYGLSSNGFNKKFTLLQSFRCEFGHTRVPKDCRIKDLRKWVELIRFEYGLKQRGIESYLTEDHINRLDGIGFEWVVPKKAQLEQQKRHKSSSKPHTNASQQSAPPNDSLLLKTDLEKTVESQQCKSHVQTVTTQPTKPSNDLSNDSLQIQIDAGNVSFTKRLEQLNAYYCKYSHAHVPQDYREAPGLRNWLYQMRHLYMDHRSFFSEEELQLLSNLKFDWLAVPTQKQENPNEASWLHNLKLLVDYESTHGDTRVPQLYKENQTFADWVHSTRDLFSKRCNGDDSALDDKTFLALKDLKFEAARMDEPSGLFRQRLLELKDHYGVFGHTKVKKTYKGAPGLQKWLAALRIKYKLWEEGDPTALSVQELKELHSLEIDWLGRRSKYSLQKHGESPSKHTDDPATIAAAEDDTTKRECAWLDRMKQLEDFKAVHGHIFVPTVYEADQSFSNWLRSQKRLFGQRTRGIVDALSDDRFEALKRIGLE